MIQLLGSQRQPDGSAPAGAGLLLLLTGLVLVAAGFGLWASEHWLLYARLGFPADAVGHGPVHLLAHPLFVVLAGASISIVLAMRRRPRPDRTALRRLLYGILGAILILACIAAPIQAVNARAAFRAGSPVDYPATWAPLPVQAWPAKVIWRPDTAPPARIGQDGMLFVRWTKDSVWLYDTSTDTAVAVPADRIDGVTTSGPPSRR